MISPYNEQIKKALLSKLEVHIDDMLKRGFGEIKFAVVVKNGVPTLIRYVVEATDKLD